MPNHRMTSGISASAGMLRTICKVESSSCSPRRKLPVKRPSASPSPPPIARPDKARPVLTPMWCVISPDHSKVAKAFSTAAGSGSTRVDNQPAREAISQAMRIATGKNQGKREGKSEGSSRLDVTD